MGQINLYPKGNWYRLAQEKIDQQAVHIYMEQSVEVRLDAGERWNVKTGRGVRQGSCLSQILFNL